MLLTQYGLEMSLVVATYSDRYVEYLLDGKTPVLRTDLKEADMLNMERLGVWASNNTQDAFRFAVLVATLMLQDRDV